MNYVTKILASLVLVTTFAAPTTGVASEFSVAADGCFAAGQSLAEERGVALVAAQATVQKGENVCKIVVLLPATNGGRPKREIIYLPR